MKSVDVGILPSRTEGIAPSIIEFMTCGIPIIATNVGGTPEIIKDNINGLLVKPDPSSIAEAIIMLYNNAEVRKILSINGKKDSEAFSIESSYNDYLLFFENIIKKSRMY